MERLAVLLNAYFYENDKKKSLSIWKGKGSFSDYPSQRWELYKMEVDYGNINFNDSN